MSGHTPGPWVAREADRTGFVVISTAEEGEYVVDSCDECGRYGPIKTSADAMLIAAAPDMLAALKWVNTSCRDDHPNMWTAISQAIAKATGEKV